MQPTFSNILVNTKFRLQARAHKSVLFKTYFKWFAFNKIRFVNAHSLRSHICALKIPVRTWFTKFYPCLNPLYILQTHFHRHVLKRPIPCIAKYRRRTSVMKGVKLW